MYKPISIFIFILILNSIALSAKAQQFRSGSAEVVLVELYTSQGCSSCPPADRWLSSSKAHDSLWKKFVPIAFHVDYWDYIGWQDRFAQNRYSQRQRRYASEFEEATVYTPAVRIAGREWQRWRNTNFDQLNSNTQVGDLRLDISEQGGLNASFTANDSSAEEGSFILNVALLGQNLSSKISRGENRGKRLEHDFVVIGMSKLSVTKISEATQHWVGKIPSALTQAPNYAVAAWITRTDSLSPIQAVGGPLSPDRITMIEYRKGGQVSY